MERGNGAEGLAPPTAKFCFSLFGPFGDGRGSEWYCVWPLAVPKHDRENLTPLWWPQMDVRRTLRSVLLL